MVKRLKLTPKALEDLKNIRRFHRNAPVRAAEIKDNILKGYSTLRQFPFAGTTMDIPYLPKIYRSLVIDKHYKLIYRVNKDSIDILSIWDCRQDPNRIFDIII